MRKPLPAVLAAVAFLATLCGTARAQNWAPVPGNIMTRWAAQVDPENVWPEYPRPSMTRPDWKNLNGLWQFQAATADDKPPVGITLTGRILVPFPVESALSGVKSHMDRMWYRRTFDVPSEWSGRRVLLHFDAVDWLATVVVNGKQIGSHRGGYDRFTFDITSALKPTGPQELIVYVFDPTDQGEQARGKQMLNPNGIWYTPSTGIWQTVWLEPAPASRIGSFHAVPDIDNARLRIRVDAVNGRPSDTVKVTALSAGQTVGEVSGAPGADLLVPVPQARLWSPEDPFLYDMRITLSRDGQVVDEVGSYFGMRKVSLGKDQNNITRPMLNGQFVLQVGPLDQGYWPDGLHTPPSEAAMLYDLELTKRLGFNMTRKHIKVEPERWYYWTDKMGLLVWQDMPNGAATSINGRTQFEKEMRRMIETRWNHPSIVLWVVFNEGWGQYDTPRLTQRVKAMDPSRLVNNATGWTDFGVGDTVDWHVYPGPGSPNPEPTRAAVLGEFGGLGLVVKDHLWKNDTWSYAGYNTSEDLTLAYEDLMRGVYRLKDNPGLSAVVYTQITDVETEINGLVTYDRAVVKVDEARISRLNRGIFPPPPVYVSPTSEQQGVEWRYTTATPSAQWMTPDFSDAAWSSGPGGFGTAGTPGTQVRTTWNTNDIWLRRAFTVTSVPDGLPVLRLHHDEDAEVYINGVLAATFTGYTSNYRQSGISAEAAATIKPGRNVIAVHCRQTIGGQYIDVGLAFRNP